MCLIPMQHKPLWTCPKCGHSFVTRNIWHSCNRYRRAVAEAPHRTYWSS